MNEAPIAHRVIGRMRRQVRSKTANLAAFRDGKANAAALQASTAMPGALKDMHPAHAMYAHVQNQMSVIVEQLLELAEMNVFAKMLRSAHEEYMPSWPPMSPITTSFFWCWANCDATANAYRETMGSVALAVAAEFGVHLTMLDLMRTFETSFWRSQRLRNRCPFIFCGDQC